MTKNEYIKQTELIELTYGKPLFNKQGSPANDSAKKLMELKEMYAQSLQQDALAKVLQETADKLDSSKQSIEIPEHLVRPEWLVSFNDQQKIVVAQWVKNTEQSVKQISKAVSLPENAVKAVMSLEAFKLLRKHILNEWKEATMLSALFILRELMLDKETDDTVKKDIAKLLLMDAGVLKADKVGVDVTKRIVFDPAKEDEYRELGNALLRLSDIQTDNTTD